MSDQSEMQIGAWVLIHNLPDNGREHEGEIGTLANINEHNSDGDFYGVNFSGEDDSHIVYFWREELTILTSEEVERDRRAREADEKDIQQIAQEWREYRNEGLGTGG